MNLRPRLALALLSAVLLGGCDSLIAGVQKPKASFSKVDLVESPSSNQMLAWSCYEYVGLGCSYFSNSKPSDTQMAFSFDAVFDVQNPNDTLPIPLVELLLGVSVFEDTNLGAICISFCDPEEESCVATTDAEGSCVADNNDTTDVQTAEDLVPTVDDLVGLAEGVTDGNYENWQYRVIEPNSSTEAHIQFDFNVDVIMGLAERLVTDAVGDALSGRDVSFQVPYIMQGSVFFEVPDLGNYAVGFGPADGVWDL